MDIILILRIMATFFGSLWGLIIFLLLLDAIIHGDAMGETASAIAWFSFLLTTIGILIACCWL